MDRENIGLRYWRVLGLCGLVCLVALIVAFLGVSVWIGADVKAVSREAMDSRAGDRVEALMTALENPAWTLEERNRAVWALGQLGDKRALPLLKRHYTGGPCDHDRQLCQRELRKAIDQIESGINATAIVWR